MLTRSAILRLFEDLNQELAAENIVGELYLVGGAVMALVYNARPSTHDLDAYFKPTQAVRAAAARLAVKQGLGPGWLNDAVKGYLSSTGTFSPFWERSHLRVLTAQPEYLLAMKCLSMRLGPEFHDESDVRFLLRTLNIETYQAALDILTRYYPLVRFPQKTLYALEEILAPRNIQ